MILLCIPYSIKDLTKIKDYVLNVIGSLRTTAFKHIDIKIESPYPIVNFFESSRLNTTFKANTKNFNIHILQFITGHQYTYVVQVKIEENVKTGDNVLEVNAEYQDFNGNSYSIYNYINFYYAIGCFNCYREEYFRCLAVQSIEGALANKNNMKSLFDKVRNECGDDLNKNISNALNEIEKNYDLCYTYVVFSEASFKRGGMNFWYSNEYQYELINDFLYQEDHRYYWERFHVPYWKLTFLRRIHRAIGVLLQFIYILFIVTLCIPLSLLSFYALKGLGRLIFNMVAGVIIQFSLFDVAFLNVFI